MSLGLDDASIPQISDAVTTILERAQACWEENNAQQAREALQEAEEQASTSDEYGLIAGIILSGVGDEEWGRKVLDRAMEQASSATALATLAGCALQIGDLNLARTIISKSVERVTSANDALGAAAIAEVFGEDPALAESLRQKAESLTSSEKNSGHM